MAAGGDGIAVMFDPGGGAATFTTRYTIAAPGSVVVAGMLVPAETAPLPPFRVGRAFAMTTDMTTAFCSDRAA